MAYRIMFKPAARRELATLERDTLRRVDNKILSLAETPRPPDSEKLKGHESWYRVRVGDYRIIYDIQNEVLIVLVIAIGHRREIYRKL